jgi:NTP pyrophosphatase (non-canonical NTP hydrolase)
MTRMQHLLTILAEECNEVAQRASKAIRFGVEEIEPGQDKTNAQRVIQEFNDLTAVYLMVSKESGGLFDRDRETSWLANILKKQAKVEKFLKYSQELGQFEVEKPKE